MMHGDGAVDVTDHTDNYSEMPWKALDKEKEK
jgi:hypothetical protein